MTSKSVLVIIGISGFLALFPFSCENNNELDLYGVQNCDTTNITWDSKIAAIMNDNCVECHGEELSYNRVRHDSYSSELVVVNDGRLKRVINDKDPATRMPKNKKALDNCKLMLINLWIEKGAPEK